VGLFLKCGPALEGGSGKLSVSALAAGRPLWCFSIGGYSAGVSTRLTKKARSQYWRRARMRLPTDKLARATSLMAARGEGSLTYSISKARREQGLVEGAAFFVIFQPRVSSESPRLNAFCRVAPSVLFRVRAVLAARVLFRASAFSVCTSEEDHERRLEFLGI
jgi:hypothetical protein